jgi:hypothetical protein
MYTLYEIQLEEKF